MRRKLDEMTDDERVLMDDVLVVAAVYFGRKSEADEFRRKHPMSAQNSEYHEPAVSQAHDLMLAKLGYLIERLSVS